ncbi:MAG: radical SAM protein [Proteobacteria bacterium]|nr:radical SAM protein [Pseudomonadota bacterium]MBU1419285.1 radical SAM protein [Pseudomonadota bacterium]MBU1453228.1 radical SAM protein [Pseudomonadota bacterium]
MSDLKISEIFYSIQGESSYAGLPCVFIRLGGCNLRCNYCDATYTWTEEQLQGIESIVSAIDRFSCSLVEVTGGEPLIQENTPELLSRLLERGKTVLLESNGSIAIDRIPDGVISILDVKCPDSGSSNSFHPDNMRLIKERLQRKRGSCELKFVLASKKDYLWARDFVTQHELIGLLPLLFSPVQGRLAPPDLAAWILEDSLPVRLQIQLHVALWPDISRGV